jgi:hypothetical protein
MAYVILTQSIDTIVRRSKTVQLRLRSELHRGALTRKPSVIE